MRPWNAWLSAAFCTDSGPNLGEILGNAHFVIAVPSKHHESFVKHAILRALPILCGFGLVLRAAPVRAADPVQLVYAVPDGCPSESDFRAAVTERGGRFDGASAPGSARGLRVSIVRDEPGFRGSLQSSIAESSSAVREVHGASCQEVVDALAVVSALALRGEDQPPPAATAKPVPAPAVTQPPAAAPAPPVEPEHYLRASGSISKQRMQVSAGTLSFDKARALSVFAGGEVGLLPGKVVPRLDLSIDVANFVTTPNGKSFLDGILTRVRLSYLGKATQSFHGTDSSVASPVYASSLDSSATVQGVSFGMALCWSPTYDTRGFVALFCVEYGAGVLQIREKGTSLTPTYVQPDDRTKTAGFGTAGVGFEGRYNLGSLFHVALKVGADAVVNTVSAERSDGSQIFHSSNIVGYGMLGLGLHF